MADHIEELRKRGMITSLAKVPGAKTDSEVIAAQQLAPPSSPAGVEEMAGLLERIRDLLASLPMDCLGTGIGASGQTYPIRDEVIHGITKALAQQPAAVVGEEIMVNAAHDVYILPLQPSGLLSGPRFVVHVPAPEQQPAAVDEVLAAVRAEVARATAKFPTWPTDPLHASGVVQEESGELAKAVLQAVYEPHKSTPEDAATEAFQTAAMAVRFLLSMDRYKWVPGEQHEQSAALATQQKEPNDVDRR